MTKINPETDNKILRAITRAAIDIDEDFKRKGTIVNFDVKRTDDANKL